ncbi:Type I Iterative PKS [Bacidia gigantensis]|uniref:Type I Iterative PKS n=1 Tax=Bacidia gigantensis TaxID=2732470 RepID=UPI001D054A6C|nr:Type I Iterative PKS [Bacidia gigantensis]KAG8533016.1 Type I Iterative PKS [Bacidia gigantensis]
MSMPDGNHHAGTSKTEQKSPEPIPIAIIGMGCRYPGGATDPSKLWQMCVEQRDVWSPIPKDRFNSKVFYHPDPGRNGTFNALGAHFLDEHPGYFDAPFFNVTKAEATAMDPQQRLLLECSFEALENAGIPLEKVSGSDTAVFVGSSCADYTTLLQHDPDKTALYQSTGSGQTMLSNRLSYFFNLKGPSATVDTACSSSLVALHLACNTIRSGESKQAIVGGSNLILTPEPMIALSMLRLLSPDGRCHSFDDRANGFGRGEGLACIVLKRLDKALKDGDDIRAVIRNTGSGQDGRTSGITLPNGKSQADLMNHLYHTSGLDPAETTYVEAHGTGTQAGDPIEAASLSKVFSPRRSSHEPLVIGSIKSNIGHLEGGSGLAAVVKTVLMLEKGLILPNFDFRNPNPQIPIDDWNVKVSQNLEEWNPEHLRRASINNFGFGGSNAHVIIEEAPNYLSRRVSPGYCKKLPPVISAIPVDSSSIAKKGLFTNGDTPTDNTSSNGDIVEDSHSDDSFQVVKRKSSTHVDVPSRPTRPHLFVLSAFSELSGNTQAERLRRYLEDQEKDFCSTIMDDLAFTLGERRSALTWRAGVLARSVSDLLNTLQTGKLKFSRSQKVPTLGFIFTGQGAQWHAMGRELMIQYPIFRDSLNLSDRYLKSFGAAWSLWGESWPSKNGTVCASLANMTLDELMKDAETSNINSEYLSQPLCTVIQIALVDLLEAWNIRPTSVTGHSSGEIAAAYSCGALSHRSALAVAYHRGIAAAAVKAHNPFPAGAMMAVGMSATEAQSVIATLTQGRLNVACINSPQSITVSGDKPAIIELQSILHTKGIFARLLKVNVAYHSHHMTSVADSYLQMLQGLQVNRVNSVGFFSTVSGDLQGPSILDEGYWVSNLTSPVRFSESVQQLCSSTNQWQMHQTNTPAAVDCLVEIGPHSALKGPLNQILKSTRLSTSNITYLPSLMRNADAGKTMLDLAGGLFKLGVPVNMQAINRPVDVQTPSVLVDLPPYPWDHSTLYWLNSSSSERYRNGSHSRSDFLGVPVKDSNSLEPIWKNHIRLSDIPWLETHKIQSNVVYPAAGYLNMAMEAEDQRSQSAYRKVIGYDFREISIKKALVISHDNDEVETMFTLRPYNQSVQLPSDTWDEFSVSSSVDGATWTENCHGLISVRKESEVSEVDGGREASESIAENERMISRLEIDCKTKLDIQEAYEGLKNLGLDYGPMFANMKEARVCGGGSIAVVSVPDTAAIMPANFEYPFIVHPALLDSCLHAIFMIGKSYTHTDQGTPVPTFIKEALVSQNVSKQPGHEMTAYASLMRNDLGRTSGKGLDRTTSNVSVFDKASTYSHPSISVSGLRFTSIGQVASKEAIMGSEKAISYQTIWQPSSNFLSADQWFKVTSHLRRPSLDATQDEKLQQAAFYYAERVMNLMSSVEPSSLAPHYRKLYKYLSGVCTKVQAGQLGEASTASWLSTNAKQKMEHCRQFKGTSWAILCSIGDNLPHILSQELDPLSLMLENNRLEEYYRADQRLLQCYEQAAYYTKLLAYKNPVMRVLEIGAGTGGASLPILKSLGGTDGNPPLFLEYDFTDVSPAFFEKAMEKTEPWAHLIKFKKLDIELDPLEQGFEPGSYDLIIASNVLHATKCMEDTLSRVRSLLKPGASLLLVETTAANIVISLIFGTLPAWWAGEEDYRQDGPLLTEPQWDAMLRKTGYTGLEANLWDMPEATNHCVSTMVSLAALDHPVDLPDIAIITSSEPSGPSVGPFRSLYESARKAPQISSLASYRGDGQVCIMLSELTSSVLRNPSPEQYAAIKRLLLGNNDVLWVTQGALIESGNPDSNLALGLLRTIREEKGDTMLVHLDLDPDLSLDDPEVEDTIVSILKANFNRRLPPSASIDTEYTLRGGLVMVPRVVEDKTLTSFVTSSSGARMPEDQLFHQDQRPLKAEVKTPGLLDSIQFVDDERAFGYLPDDHVEVEMKAAGLNFRDVMSSLGQIDPYPLGVEGAGVITAVGKDVSELQIGDHVIATSNGGCFCSCLRVPANTIELIPKDMPFEIGASLPIAYMTAYYAVFKIARLSKGETVLVHAATGGLGQALLNLCHVVGAEVFATVGTLEKKDLLMKEFAIPEDHIFSSRDGTFAKGVMRMTNGRGVDAIMNSLSGDLLRLSWDCIADFGRFVELGKRDFTVNSRLEMRNFEKNVTFTGLDLPIESQREEKHKIWKELMRLYQEGRIRAPHPITVFPMSQLEKALRTMQSGKHMGKLVLMPQPDEIVKVVPQDDSHRLLRADATYFLVGGLGGIGRALALWMTGHGARNFIFLSPSGLDKAKSKEAIALLHAEGARVNVFKGDVSNLADVQRALKESSNDMPPVRGVIQAAMVPAADLFENMTLEDYNAAMRPKVDGTWNLHNTLSPPSHPHSLDFFICLSSVVGLVGNPSQASYVASSLFLDAFADFRAHLNLPAVTLDLGRVVGVGFVAENEAARRGTERLWSRDISEGEVMRMVEEAIREPFRGRRNGKGEDEMGRRSGSSITGLKTWKEDAGAVYDAPLFSHWRRAAMASRNSDHTAPDHAGANMRDVLRMAKSREEATDKACEAIMAKMATLLMIQKEDIRPEGSMVEYGLDSLVAVEMRNWLVREMDATVPVLELLANRSVRELAGRVVKGSGVVGVGLKGD